MTENQPDVYFSWKPDEQNESSDTFASEAVSKIFV
jgi:hypothetical protein